MISALIPSAPANSPDGLPTTGAERRRLRSVQVLSRRKRPADTRLAKGMMDGAKPIVSAVLGRLRDLREARGISEAALEERMILGPGWISRFESGQTVPNLDMLLAILHEVGASPNDLFGDLPAEASAAEVERYLYAVPNGKDLSVRFRYANFDAEYGLDQASLEEFEAVLKTLRDGLAGLAARAGNAEAIKTQAVARTFLAAVRTWPHANPSDLWYFLVYRAYCDSFNHPAEFARLDFSQSWKRTGGWALEEVLVQHYGPFLAKNGVNLFIAHGERKEQLLAQLKVRERLEADKVDVLLTRTTKGVETCFGVVHVKASFAERRTDDVPMSKALVDAGYVSPLWTMDCKSMPSARPDNRGELGDLLADGRDVRSAKRKDIEDDGYFSACFSYNRNTKPTPPSQKAKARVIVCDFRSPDDTFSQFIIKSSRQRGR